jgi:hypothetical protein
MPLPLWALSTTVPWPAAAVVFVVFGLFGGLVNPPILGILTTRPPAALRAKVMAAVMTIATGAGPLGFLGAGEALRYVSLNVLFMVIAALLTATSLAFAAVLRRGGSPTVAELAPG